MDMARERWMAWCRDAVTEGLFEAHWLEVGVDRDKIKLEIDFESFALLEHIDRLRCYTARINGQLRGYAVFVVCPHLHYKSHKFALCDSIYVAEECRGQGNGRSLARFAERALLADGVAVITHHFKVAHDQAKMMGDEGYDPAETIYRKCLI